MYMTAIRKTITVKQRELNGHTETQTINKVTKQTTSYKIINLTIDESVTIPTEILLVCSNVRRSVGG